LQEAIKKAFRCNRERFVRLVLTVITEHVREHLGIEDAAAIATLNAMGVVSAAAGEPL
jgi:hypothetical protein